MTRYRRAYVWLGTKTLLPLLMFPAAYVLVVVASSSETFSWAAVIFMVAAGAGGVMLGMGLMRRLLPGLMASTLIDIREKGRNYR